ncbi:toxin-antitoxin system YwqK family antitoxin [Polaribacter uvawellassae]|uniref:toxin-antitoxin system YwqK family antitoxin n=1 Tax=Polaribacter uvawellassae TaxID=3133495 RepID=UPI00321A2B13
MKKNVTLLFCFLTFSTIQSQSAGKIFTDIEKVYKGKKTLLNYINKIASSTNKYDKNNYSKKAESKAKEYIRILKRAQNNTIILQRSKNGDEYKKLRSKTTYLQRLLYHSFTYLKELTVYTDRFVRTSNNNNKSKNYKNIAENYKSFSLQIQKARKLTLEIHDLDNSIIVKSIEKKGGNSNISDKRDYIDSFDKKINDVVIKKTYYGDGSLDQIKYYKDNKRHGNWKSYWENGRLFSSTHYLNGKKDGKWIYYLVGGQLYKINYYKNDKRVGVWTKYNKDGSVHSTIDYSSDK